jgi:hypothetical protein
MPARDRPENKTVLLPLEPTPEMVSAGASVLYAMDLAFGTEPMFAENVYKAMVKAWGERKQ